MFQGWTCPRWPCQWQCSRVAVYLASPGVVISSSRSTYWALSPNPPEPEEHVKEQSSKFHFRWMLMQLFSLFDSIRKCKHQVAHYAQQTFRIVGLGWHSFFIANCVELSCAFAGGHNSGFLSARSSTMMIVVQMLISDQGQAESDRHIYIQYASRNPAA